MRDLVVHDNDLIVATHGRGFLVLDDITPLRQINEEVVKFDAFLFRPADAFNLPLPSENGTQPSRDEPLAENQPNGAIIDYYLKSKAAGAVTLEILNPAGELIRRYSSEDKSVPANTDTIDIPAFWIKTPPPVLIEAGMHCWVWDLCPRLRQPIMVQAAVFGAALLRCFPEFIRSN